MNDQSIETLKMWINSTCSRPLRRVWVWYLCYTELIPPSIRATIQKCFNLNRHCNQTTRNRLWLPLNSPISIQTPGISFLVHGWSFPAIHVATVASSRVLALGACARDSALQILYSSRLRTPRPCFSVLFKLNTCLT